MENSKAKNEVFYTKVHRKKKKNIDSGNIVRDGECNLEPIRLRLGKICSCNIFSMCLLLVGIFNTL